MIDRISKVVLAVTAGALVWVASASCSGEDCKPLPETALGEPTEWEREFAQENRWPDAPEAKFTDRVEGLPLAYREWRPDGWDTTGAMVLFVHGSSAHSGEYTVLGRGLANRGVLARLVDLRGHGLSICRPDGNCSKRAEIPRDYTEEPYYPGRIGDSHDANQLIRDLSYHVDEMRERWPKARLTLSGHSSGAGLVSRFVEHGGLEQLDGVALLAPFHHPEQPQSELSEFQCGAKRGNGYAVVDMGALGAAQRGERHRYVLSFRKAEPYLHPLDTLKNTYTTMRGMQVDHPDRYAAAYTKPALWVAAERDALLDVGTQRDRFERLPAGGQFVVVERTSHVGLGWSTGVADLLARWSKNPTSVDASRIEPVP